MKQGTFDLSIGLKEEWRGIIVMTQLKSVSKIDDIVFVHNSDYIGCARSYESTLRMTLESIDDHNSKQDNNEIN